MSLYGDVIFPRVLDLVMGQRRLMECRRTALAAARGDMLEIGFGTGLNLACYPAGVSRLTIIDPARHLPKKVEKRIREVEFPVEHAQLDATALPFDAGRFDTVVSTWTLCTIPDVEQALAEVRRVLAPTGKFLFLEHGRSEDPRVARRQDRWNSVQKFVACGCHLNRPIDRLIDVAGLTIERLERFEMPGTPAILAAHYTGMAQRKA
ncbi:MAG: class I SAM-dependent methyltransferase [Pirellulales bacterium]|nr:class I SAM-dependent methyltransferase [Pirellulales bacterium]